MCAVARYNHISSTDRGDIFIQWVPKQDFIVVPPPSNIMEVKNKNTYHKGSNRTLTKYKSKLNSELLLHCIIYKIVALDRPMAIIQLSD